MRTKSNRWRVGFGMAALSIGLLAGSGAMRAEGRGGADTTLAAHDAMFLKQAIMSDHAAIDAGNLALKKTSNDRLKQIAQTVVDTHTKMLGQLEEEAKSGGITAPSEASPMAKEMCMKMEGMHGAAFDHAFISDMIKLHYMEQKGFQMEAKGGKAEPLMKISQDQLPVIQQHLDDLRGIQKNGL